MKIVKVFLVLSVLLSITGCSPLVNNNPTKVETSSNGSYKALLFVNGMELQSVGHTANESELVVGEFIGAVNEKVDIEIRPSDELTSNYLEEGTEIYSVEGNTKIVLAKKENGDYEVFE
ncbi:hypothetical protein JOC85_002611 [Bacillus mesophilus]|uniref:DUF3221 domain-containing protein n=1 Tax=Bacillus mesophilus TaxID=1808955 RepID=A0A6M0QD69_9BACI|nr:hypothetical protein [Bacillus mesophilus]MBM7661804.1 hypothetical protein [Bacillus mesophilus]NEY74215.1 hypothetical protein [Bacillus mesophilus]